MHSLRGRDFLSLGDITPAELTQILETAHAQKRSWAREERSTPLAGKAIALIFQKPSMRTRVSFELACTRLGAHPIVMSGNDSAFSRSESVYDTTKVLERYCDAIVIRTFDQSMVEEIAHVASVPVVNALTDDHHPCQGLADLLTIEEHLGRLKGVHLAYVGDGNNMAHTYMLGGALAGMHVSIACPEGFHPLDSVLEQARSIAGETGATIALTSDPVAGVAGADVVLTDTWASMGQEDEHDTRLAAFQPFQVNEELMAHAAGGALFMHCLPAHRNEEVTDAIIDDPCSIVFDEAENRLHAQKALLSLLLG